MKSSIISSISYLILSYRQLQGEFFYLEINMSDEDTVFVTACATGFFINRSTTTAFDPVPAEHPCFSHELLFTLLAHNQALRTAWTSFLQPSSNVPGDSASVPTSNNNTGSTVMNFMASLYAQGRGDQLTIQPHWIQPPTGNLKKSGPPPSANEHAYDPGRAVDDLLDMFGMEEKGAAREW